jgi:hypothetical protein
MAERIGAEVEVRYQSVGEMRKAIKEATSDVIRMQQEFGSTSKEAMAAAKRVAELKDRVKEASEVADLFDPGNKFKALGNTVMVAANGFTALQGAMGLLGVESEDLEKQLLKVQSAMALTQGLSSLADSGKEFMRLGSIIQNQVTKAFTTLRGAIIATGFGALAVLLGTIVAYWEDIVSLVDGVSTSQKKLNAETQKNLETQQEKVKALDSQDNVLKLQGKSEREILQLKVQQVKEAIAAAKVNIENAKITKQAQVEAAERNQRILAGYLKWIQAPIVLLSKALDGMARLVGKDLGLEAKIDALTKYAASFVFDPAETEAKGEANINAAVATLNELENRYAGYQLRIKEIDKKAATESKKTADDKKKEEEERQRALAEQRTKDREAEAAAEQAWLNQQVKANADANAAIDKENEEFQKREQERQEKRIQDQLAYNQALIQAERDLQAAKFDAAQAGVNLLMQLAGKNKTLANTLFILDKALAIARVVVNTQQEIAGYWANPTWSLMPDGGATLKTAMSLKAKIRAGISIATIAASTIQKYMSGAGGANNTPQPQIGNITTAAPMQAALSPAAQAQALNAQAINNMGNQAVQAYVLNSDLQNNNQINAFLQRNASIG